MEEKALKRKRDEQADFRIGDIVAEQPREGLREPGRTRKKQKRTDTTQEADGEEKDLIRVLDSAAPKPAKLAKRKEKIVRKNAKRLAIETNHLARKAQEQKQATLVTGAEGDRLSDMDRLSPFAGPAAEIDQIDGDGMVDEKHRESSSTVSSSRLSRSPAFDLPTGQSGASSTSSIVPPLSREATKQQSDEPLRAKADPTELKARLQKRIEALRAARKADGLNGSPARNRQELMEARRRKEDQRRAHKKELRQIAQREEQRAKDEALIARTSPLSVPRIENLQREDSRAQNNFSFGRVAFEDGDQMDSTLSTVLGGRKQKGPQDPLTALKAAENKQKRIKNFDEAKRANIEEKDIWLNARKRAHGERVHEDASLLKKTLKRKEKAKQKSEKEWKERLEGVEKGKAMRQKKRDENLRKRKDERGTKGRKNKGSKDRKSSKPKPRAGFEGSFMTKIGGGGGSRKAEHLMT